jgi:hypothetical protein
MTGGNRLTGIADLHLGASADLKHPALRSQRDLTAPKSVRTFVATMIPATTCRPGKSLYLVFSLRHRRCVHRLALVCCNFGICGLAQHSLRQLEGMRGRCDCSDERHDKCNADGTVLDHCRGQPTPNKTKHTARTGSHSHRRKTSVSEFRAPVRAIIAARLNLFHHVSAIRPAFGTAAV